MNNKSIERLVFLGFGVSLALILLLSGVTWYGARTAGDASGWVAHTQEVLASIRQVISNVYRAEAAQRAYFLTERQIYLTERSNAWVDLEVEVVELARLTRDNSFQQQRIPPLQEALVQRKDILDNHMRLFQENNRAKGFEAIRADFDSGHNRTQVIARILAEMQGEEERLLAIRQAEYELQQRIATASFACLVVVLCVMLAFLSWRIRQDMRSRLLAEAAQAKLTAILDATPDLVATCDSSRRMTYINRAGRRILGIALDDPLRNITVGDLHPGDGSGTEEDRFSIADRQGTWRGETVFVTREGKQVPTLQVVMAHPQPNGTTEYSTIAHDISERHQNEEAQRQTVIFEESHGRALSLFNSTFDMQAILDQTLALLADRHPFPASAIYLYDEWHGCYRLTAKHGCDPAILESFRNGEGMLGEAVASQKPLLLADTSTASGMRLETGVAAFAPAAVLAMPIVYQGRTLGVLTLAASRPIDDRDQGFVERIARQLGVALHNLKLYGDTKLLAEQLRAGSEEIARKNTELEQASRTKSEFLANMSHELRTPLNAVVGFAEVLKDGLAGPLTPQQREYISDIFASGQHLLSLINDILDLSKVEAGKMVLQIAPTKLQPLLANALSIVKEKASAHNIHLELDVDASLGEVQVDERRLKQVVYNLLSNALKFSPDGAEISVRARPLKRAEVGNMKSGMPARTLPLAPGDRQDFFEISIADRGIGISESGLTELFQPFTQVDGSLARKFEGTGLGLVMVSRLVGLHGGTVGITSAEGKGTRFAVWLPVQASADAQVQISSAEPSKAMPPPRPLPPMPGSPDEPRWVLVVEDDDRAAEVIRLQLETEGLCVQRASTAEEGLRLARERRFSLITLDIMLPGMDGWEFLARIKEDPDTATLPVVIISIVADTNRGLSLGASAILQKPISHETLISTLGELGFAGFQETPLDVLVVDDDPRSVEIIANYLQRAGCRVVRAYGGKEGIDTALSLTPDLIVLDLMMPEVSGFDVVETLKGDKRTALIPILVVTAKQVEARDRELLQGQVMKIVEKVDFNHGRFVSEVRRVMATVNRGAQ